MIYKKISAVLIILCLGSFQETRANYNRADWPHWIDIDQDCQDTRAEILIAESEVEVIFRNQENGKSCVVNAGQWTSLYSGQIVLLASELHIDHLVPLKNAYLNGGKDWSRSKKQKFANDWQNLVPTPKRINSQKSDRGPDQWKPERREYWCYYAKKWIAVKEAYDLAVPMNEAYALNEMLETCGLDE